MSERIDWTKLVDGSKRAVDRIAALEAQVEADAALWEFIRENEANLVFNEDGTGWELTVLASDQSLGEVIGMGSDPLGAVRKAVGYEWT